MFKERKTLQSASGYWLWRNTDFNAANIRVTIQIHGVHSPWFLSSVLSGSVVITEKGEYRAGLY